MLVQVSYAIGVARPTSVMVTTHGTGKLSDEKLSDWCRGIRPAPEGYHPDDRLLPSDLREDAAYGHFGRDEAEFTGKRRQGARARADSGIKQPAMA